MGGAWVALSALHISIIESSVESVWIPRNPQEFSRTSRIFQDFPGNFKDFQEISGPVLFWVLQKILGIFTFDDAFWVQHDNLVCHLVSKAHFMGSDGNPLLFVSGKGNEVPVFKIRKMGFN